MSEQGNSALEAWLAEIEAEIADKLRLASELRRRLGLEEMESTPVSLTTPQAPRAGQTSGRIRPDEFFRMSMPDAIRHFLAIMKAPQSPKAIEEGLKSGGLLTNSKFFYANVSTSLKRLRDQEKAVLTPNGWGLSEWYPSKPKMETKKPKRKAKKRSETPKAPEAKPSEVKAASGFREFSKKALAEGKTMKQVGEEWQALKAARVGG